MKAVILAAGEGTRLRPRTEEMPKPLVEVGGTPILTRCFETVLELGIEAAVVVVGYELPDAVDLLLHAGYEVETVPFEGWKVNVDTPTDIERAERNLSGK